MPNNFEIPPKPNPDKKNIDNFQKEKEIEELEGDNLDSKVHTEDKNTNETEKSEETGDKNQEVKEEEKVKEDKETRKEEGVEAKSEEALNEEELKKETDPLYKFWREIGIEIKGDEFSYRVPVEIEIDPNNPEILASVKYREFNNYHDYVEFINNLPEKQKKLLVEDKEYKTPDGKKQVLRPRIHLKFDFLERIKNNPAISDKERKEFEDLLKNVRDLRVNDEYPETKEKKEEEIFLKKADLEEVRAKYIEAYHNFIQKHSQKKFTPFQLAVYEKRVEPERKKYIVIGDSERLKKGDKRAEERRKRFIDALIEKGIKLERAEAIYEAELRKAEYERIKKELALRLKEDGLSTAEIFQELVIQEREILTKNQIESFPPKERGIIRKGLEWWMRRGTTTRLLISTALLTGVVASAGGLSAPAVAMFAGYRFVRGAGAVLAGKMAGKGVEWILSRRITAQKEAALSKLRDGFTPENLEEVNDQYEKILEEIGKKERRKRLIKCIVSVAAGVGTAIGLGLLEQSLGGARLSTAETIKKTPETEPTGKTASLPKSSGTTISEARPSSGAGPESGGVKTEGVETREGLPIEQKATVENIVEVKKGDSLWKILERQLEKRYGERFAQLNEAQKTYIIDSLKDRVLENPSKFGLENADQLRLGQKIDVGSLFEEKTGIDKFFESAEKLSENQIKAIEHNNEVLREWIKNHPGENLDSEKVAEILEHGKLIRPQETISSLEDVPGVEVPTESHLDFESPPEFTSSQNVPPESYLERILKETLMEANEKIIIERIGFTPEEYKAIKDVTLEKLLREIPEEPKRAEMIFFGRILGKKIDLPHFGEYEIEEFRKHMKLANFVRSFLSHLTFHEPLLQMKVEQFLKTVGPEGTILFKGI